MSGSSQDLPVDLVIRFTAAIPDAVICVPSAKLTTSLALKQRIRAQLPATYAANRLRLISAGKVLPDTTALSKCINIPPPPPRAANDSADSKDKGKGKAPAQDTVSRVYVHCSIGDALTPGELSAEAEAAETADKDLLSDLETAPVPPSRPNVSTNTSTPAPRDPAGRRRA